MKVAGASDFGAIGRSVKHSSENFSGSQAEYRRVEGSSVAMRASWRELEVGLELVTKWWNAGKFERDGDIQTHRETNPLWFSGFLFFSFSLSLSGFQHKTQSSPQCCEEENELSVPSGMWTELLQSPRCGLGRNPVTST